VYRAQEKEWWKRIGEGRCPICLSKGPFQGGAIPVHVCECGNCKCEGCVDARQLERDGLPPRGEKTKGGIIIPPREKDQGGVVVPPREEQADG
jgi:hypothetical protein